MDINDPLAELVGRLRNTYPNWRISSTRSDEEIGSAVLNIIGATVPTEYGELQVVVILDDGLLKHDFHGAFKIAEQDFLQRISYELQKKRGAQ